jgi:hypothetical protein
MEHGPKMRWWQKLTIDWPCALGDWLWANIVIAPAEFLDRLTLRGVARFVLQSVIFVVLLTYFEQVASLDLTFLFYVDANVYLDVFAAIFILVARGLLLHMLKLATRIVWQSIQYRSKKLPRFGIRQRRNANALRHKDCAGSPEQSDDDPAGADEVPRYAFA